MQRSQRFGPLAIALVVPLASCQAAAPPPPELSEVDRAAIQQVAEDAVALMNAETPDLDAYVRTYYAPDAVVLPPNGPAVSGEAAILAFLQAFPPITHFAFDLLEVEGMADMAWVYGTYVLTMSPEGATPVEDTGKYLEIWKKQADGSWRVFRDIFNSDLPAM